MEKELIIKQVQSLLDEITENNKKQMELERQLIGVFPIKRGEKVNVIKTGDDSIESVSRQAYVTRVKINYRGPARVARIEFDLAICKRDGEQGSKSDHLRYNEHIQKIK